MYVPWRNAFVLPPLGVPAHLGIMKHLLAPAALTTALLLGAPPAEAHHSYALFDAANPRAAEAVVAKLEWRNPHVLLWLHVPRADGAGTELLALESDSVAGLVERGWSATALAPGDKVTVRYLPLRDGRGGGHLIDLTDASGRTLSGMREITDALIEAARNRGPRP
jgi:Family of unknown function (DUF6152)